MIITETNQFVRDVFNDFIYNRFDILYPHDYTCLIVEDDVSVFHIPLHLHDDTAYLGLWCYEISEIAFLAIIRYIFQTKRHIKKISIQNCSVSIPRKYLSKSDLQQRTHWKVMMPSTPEELVERLSSKKRYNIKREKRIAQQNLGEYAIEEYQINTIPDVLIDVYFRFKQQTYGIDYQMKPTDYLEHYHVSNIYILRLGEIIGSIVFSCEQGEQVYLENLTYNPEYKHYSLGSILYDEFLQILCKKKKASIYLGWGNKGYKSLYGAVCQTVWTGTIYRNRYNYFVNCEIKKIWSKCKRVIKRIDVLDIHSRIRS